MDYYKLNAVNIEQEFKSIIDSQFVASENELLIQLINKFYKLRSRDLSEMVEKFNNVVKKVKQSHHIEI